MGKAVDYSEISNWRKRESDFYHFVCASLEWSVILSAKSPHEVVISAYRPTGLVIPRPIGIVVPRPIGLVVPKPIGIVFHRPSRWFSSTGKVHSSSASCLTCRKIMKRQRTKRRSLKRPTWRLTDVKNSDWDARFDLLRPTIQGWALDSVRDSIPDSVWRF